LLGRRALVPFASHIWREPKAEHPIHEPLPPRQRPAAATRHRGFLAKATARRLLGALHERGVQMLHVLEGRLRNELFFFGATLFLAVAAAARSFGGVSALGSSVPTRAAPAATAVAPISAAAAFRKRRRRAAFGTRRDTTELRNVQLRRWGFHVARVEDGVVSHDILQARAAVARRKRNKKRKVKAYTSKSSAIKRSLVQLTW